MVAVLPRAKLGAHIRDQPRAVYWTVVGGACVLSVLGGYLNGASLAGVFRVGLTHLTGTTTMAAITTVMPPPSAPNARGADFFFSLIGAYALGALVAGLVVGGARSKWRGKQAAVISIESVCLWIAYALVHFPGVDQTLAASLIACASGLQNGSTSNLQIFVLRTANVTGTVVDIGLAMGQCVREGFVKHRWKLGLWIPCYVSFWVGAVCGTQAYRVVGIHAIAIGAAMATAIALATWARSLYFCVLRRRRRALGESRHASVASVAMLGDLDEQALAMRTRASSAASVASPSSLGERLLDVSIGDAVDYREDASSSDSVSALPVGRGASDAARSSL